MKTSRQELARTKLLILFAVFWIFISLLCHQIISVKGLALGQEQKEKSTTTTVADNKYGKGGTKETSSDEKLRLRTEVWKDKDGKVRQKHEIASGTVHMWTFKDKEGNIQKFLTAKRSDKGWDLVYPFSGENGRADISFDEVERIVERIEKQYAAEQVASDQSKDATGQ